MSEQRTRNKCDASIAPLVWATRTAVQFTRCTWYIFVVYKENGMEGRKPTPFFVAGVFYDVRIQHYNKYYKALSANLAFFVLFGGNRFSR